MDRSNVCCAILIASVCHYSISAVPGNQKLVEQALLAKDAGKWAESIPLWTQAIESGEWPPKKLAYLYYYRGEAHSYLKERDLAYSDAEKALSIDPMNMRALNLRGLGRIHRKEVAAGLADLEKAARVAPDFAWPLINRVFPASVREVVG